MDLFDAILDKLIPAIIIFVMLKNILGSIFGKRRSEEPEEEGEEYQEENGDADSSSDGYPEPEEEEQGDGLSREQRQILEEFERLLKQDKPAPDGSTYGEQSDNRDTQRILRDEDVVVKRDEQYQDQVLTDEETAQTVHKDGDNRQTVHQDEDGCQIVHKDADGCDVIHRDSEKLEHDKGQIYVEDPFITGAELPAAVIDHKTVIASDKIDTGSQAAGTGLQRRKHSRLLKGIIMSEILAKPRGAR